LRRRAGVSPTFEFLGIPVLEELILMSLTGHLSDLSLSELIEFFCNQRKTGELKVLYPQGQGSFYLQTGSVVDARIGVLRGIEAVYYALTLPNAKFEFGGVDGPIERTINQPWTQVVLEGLRRLDEGVVPQAAFPPDYSAETTDTEVSQAEVSAADLESLRVPSFLSLGDAHSTGNRKFLIAGAVAIAIIASVAAAGVPAGWYGRGKPAVVVSPSESQPAIPASTLDASAPTVEQTSSETPAESAPVVDPNTEAALAAKRLRDRERARAKAAAEAQTAPNSSSAGTVDPLKAGPKKVTVTVTYDESGRVTQASGGDASAIRIARQKRFPPGKAGSATITIPIN
jgi:hypothetical protein